MSVSDMSSRLLSALPKLFGHGYRINPQIGHVIRVRVPMLRQLDLHAPESPGADIGASWWVSSMRVTSCLPVRVEEEGGPGPRVARRARGDRRRLHGEAG